MINYEYFTLSQAKFQIFSKFFLLLHGIITYFLFKSYHIIKKNLYFIHSISVYCIYEDIFLHTAPFYAIFICCLTSTFTFKKLQVFSKKYII